GSRPDRALVSVQAAMMLDGIEIPETHGLIGADGRQELSAGMKGDAGDFVDVAVKVADRLSGGDVPEADALVFAGGSEPLAVLAEGDRQGCSRVSLKVLQEHARAGAERPLRCWRRVGTRRAGDAAAGEQLAIGPESDLVAAFVVGCVVDD